LTVPAIEYVSYADATGYGQAAAGYVRLLVLAGHQVHWTPYLNSTLWAGRIGREHAPRELVAARAALRTRGQAGKNNDLMTLIEATSRPMRPDLRILHVMPPFWEPLMRYAPGLPHLGMTVWETDGIAEAWQCPIASVRHLAVPCSHNIELIAALRRQGRDLPPATLVPHVCRILRPPPPSRLDALAKWAGIRHGDTVFYSINAWDPRKRLAQLVDGFARAFSHDDPAVLLLKTSRLGLFDDPAGPSGTRDVASIVQAIIARATTESGRHSGRIALLAEDDVPDSLIDGFHSLGHCFVSLSHCEGFGLGAFDAASLGRPVISVGYGGPLDYLGQVWPGRIPHTMVPCQAIEGYWFDQGQSWPQPDDAAAFAIMRKVMADPIPFRVAAETIRQRIAVQFGQQAVTERLSAAITNTLST